jgi:hypothetical protein
MFIREKSGPIPRRRARASLAAPATGDRALAVAALPQVVQLLTRTSPAAAAAAALTATAKAAGAASPAALREGRGTPGRPVQPR